MTIKDIVKNVAEVKNHIIDETYIAVVIMSGPSIIASLLFFSDNELFSVTFQIVLIMFLLYFVFLSIFRKKIPYNIKIWNLILISCAIGLYSSLILGFIGIGALYFIFSSLMITIHLKKKFAVLSFYFGIFILVLIGTLRVNKIFDFVNYKYQYFDTERYWVYCIFSFSFLLAMLIRGISILNENLSNTIEELTEKNYEVENLAYKDQLTNLPNRYKFKVVLEELVQCYSQNGSSFGLIILDVDNLKLINKQSNQHSGDMVLLGLANHLKNEFEDALLISKIDGDEFAIITVDSINGRCDEFFLRIQKACEKCKIEISGINHLTCSVGMMDFNMDIMSYELLIKNTEIALLYAKETGKNKYIIYNDEFGREIQKKENMIMELKNAIETDSIDLAYQPIYNTSSKKLYEFEVLGRWNSKLYGVVPPNVFVPLLESSGLIIPYGYKIMEKALLQLKKWHESGYDNIKVAINISAIQFGDIDFYEHTISLLERLDINPEYLELEITESIFIYDYDYIKKTLCSLNDFGIKLALDDFGTGYSSLSYLKDLPLHTLKIDKAFIDDVNIPKTKEVLVPTLIKLAHDLSLVVIAEGIESREQLNFLKANNCDYLQGYFLSKPIKVEEIDLEQLNTY